MPGLLTLKTDLKSLKYGHDQPGGGSSGQPYIKTDINTVDTGLNKLRLTKFDDGLIRGGAIGAANASIVDTLRIGKFLTDVPQGPLFIAKQVGLQLTNPRLESKEVSTNRATSGQGFLNNAINFVANVAGKIENAVGPTRIYNLGVNTLAQVPVNALGGHIVRHGFTPSIDESKYYFNVVRDNNFINDTNRLVGYSQTLIGNSNDIDDYIGGPNSVYGIGYTTIKRRGNYIWLNQDTTANEFATTGSFELSKTFAGKTRDKDGNVTEIAFGLDRLLGASNHTGSIFALPSESKAPLTNNDTNIPVNLNSQIAQDKDKHGTNTDNQKISYEDANKRLISGSFFGVSNHASSSLRPFFFLSKTNKDNISSDPANSPTVLSERLPNPQTDLFHTRNPNSPERLNSHDLSAYTDWTPSAYEGPVDTGSIDNTNPLDLPNLVYGAGVSSYSDVKAAVDNLTAPNNIGIYAQLINSQLNQERLPDSKYGPVYRNYYGEKVAINIPWRRATREIRVGSGRQDAINLTPLFTEGSYFGADISPDGDNIRDLVRFRIQAVNTDTPDNGVWMVFRAYITDLSDSVDATWNPVKYAGRGDQFYIYDGFTRKMSVSFKVAALSAEEMKPMYNKLNFLMSNLMPDYGGPDGVLMRGPLVRMSIGSWIDSQLCKIDSLSLKVTNDSPWEIAVDKPEGGAQLLILPHIIEVNMNFTPIGSESRGKNEIPRKSSSISNIAQNNTGDIGLQYVDKG